MYVIILFGCLMMLLSLIMIIRPVYWSETIVMFSEKVYFHSFEILSRIAFGVAFIIYADRTLYPGVMTIIGYILILVGAGLLIAGPVKHRLFAVWSAQKFARTFRPAGFVAFIFGAFLIYAATNDLAGR